MEPDPNRRKLIKRLTSLNRDLYHDSKDGSLEDVEFHIEEGADINSQVGDNKNGPLHIASEYGHTDVVRFLLSCGANVSIRNKSGQTPLHYAANRDIAELLIQYNAEVNIQDHRGQTPLHCVGEHFDVAEFLISAGADVKILDQEHRNALHYAKVGGVADILCKAGADLNLQDGNYRTPLHEAAWYNYGDVFRILLKAGADPRIEDHLHTTAIDFARVKKAREVIEVLENFGFAKAEDLMSPSPSQYGNIPMEILAMDDRSIEIYKNALENGKEKVYHIRLMVVGPYGVGKTSLINRLFNLKYDMAKIESTDSIDVHRFRCGITIPEGKWIFSGDGVEEMKNYDLRLGRVVTTHKPQTNTKDKLEAANKVTEEDFNTSSAANSFGMAPKFVCDNLSTVKEECQESDIISATAKTTEIVPPTLGDSVLKQESTEDSAGPSLDTASTTSASTNINQAKENLQRILDVCKSHDPQRIIGEVSVWDFGGQFTFYSTHQTFLTPRAVYLLVVNIAKTLMDVLKDDDCCIDISGIQYFKMGDYTVFWLKSIHTYGGDDINVPPVILVATHLDELQGDKEVLTEKFFCDLRRHLADSGESMVNHLADEDFSVDNTKPIDDPILEQLRSKIFEVASKQNYWGEEIPASWIALEKKLMENQVKERQVISFQDVVNMAEDLEVPNADRTHFDLFLRFQHALGNILYFSEIGEFVILEVQWLIDAFKSLITAEKFLLKKNPGVMDKWKEFSNYGILRDRLIDAVWKDKQFSEFKDHLLQIMEKLDIIAKPVVFTKEEEDHQDEKLDYFLVPCMLKESLTEERLSVITANASSTPYLCIVFENNFVPPAVFHKLLAACMKKWHVSCQGGKEKLLLFCGCGIFDIDKSRIRFMICMRYYMIKLQVFQYHLKNTGPPQLSKYVEIKTFVEEKLKVIFGAYQQRVPYKLYISCDLHLGLTDNKGLLPVEDLLASEEVRCDEHDQVHCISSIDRLKYWFDPAEYKHLVQEGAGLAGYAGEEGPRLQGQGGQHYAYPGEERLRFQSPSGQQFSPDSPIRQGQPIYRSQYSCQYTTAGPVGYPREEGPRFPGPGGQQAWYPEEEGPRYPGPGGQQAWYHGEEGPIYPGPGGQQAWYPGEEGPRYPGPGGQQPWYHGEGGPRFQGQGCLQAWYPGEGGPRFKGPSGQQAWYPGEGGPRFQGQGGQQAWYHGEEGPRFQGPSGQQVWHPGEGGPRFSGHHISPHSPGRWPQGQSRYRSSYPEEYRSGETFRGVSLDQFPTDQMLNKIAMKMGKEYFQLGIELGLATEEIEQIRHSDTSHHEICFHILRKWQAKWMSKCPQKATLRYLKEKMSIVEMNVQILFNAIYGQ